MSRSNSIKQAGRAKIAEEKREQIDVITTSQGGDDMARAAARSGALIGYESHTTRPSEEVPIDFIDWPYSKEDAEDVSVVDHLLAVEREQPKYAVAPDINDHRDFDKAVEIADRLLDHAEIVIMVPKTVEPSAIPDRFRVGVPFRDGFEGLPFPVWSYQDCGPVHVLGGHPDKQIELSEMIKAEVRSLDTAHPTMKANWGMVWTRNGYLQDDFGYYGSIQRSLKNIQRRWGFNDAAKLRKRAAQEFFDLPESDFEGDEPPLTDYVTDPALLQPDEELPHPGRAYFHEVDDPVWEPGMTAGELEAKT